MEQCIHGLSERGGDLQLSRYGELRLIGCWGDSCRCRSRQFNLSPANIPSIGRKPGKEISGGVFAKFGE
jgi:hypothetical protein